MPEVSFRTHVAARHSSDSRMVVCPVCSANGVNVRHRRLHDHLQTDHPDTHDPASHVMYVLYYFSSTILLFKLQSKSKFRLRVERMVPSCYWKLFEPLPIIPLAVDSQPSAAMQTDMHMDDNTDTEMRDAAIRNRALVSPLSTLVKYQYQYSIKNSIVIFLL